MKNLRKLYRGSSSIGAIKNLEEQGKLTAILLGFLDQSNQLRTYTCQYTSNAMEYEVITKKICDLAYYWVTDYTFVAENGENFSTEWINYVASNLQGIEKQKYLAGINAFAEKVAQMVKQDILDSVKVEKCQPEKRLIEQQIVEINSAKVPKEIVKKDKYGI